MLQLFLAETGEASAGGGLLTFLPLLLIGAFVYFAMIRPQRKRQQAVKSMQQDLSVGDDIITIGGLHGRVDTIGETTVDLEVTDDVVLRFKRSAIAEILRDEPTDIDAADDELEASDDTESAESTE